MKNFIKIFPHIVIWTIALLVPLYLISRDGMAFDYKPYVHYIMRLAILAILFYTNYVYLIDKFFFNRKFVSFIAINIALIALLVIIQSYVSEGFLRPEITERMIHESGESIQQHPHGKRGPGGPPPMMRFIFDYVSIIFVIGLSVAIKTTIRWNRDSINLEKTKSVQLEADLRNLRSQLNPHFLFNTLNNIYSLIAIDESRAQEAVHRLSSLLRYVLYEDDEKFVPIDKELEFTQNYIDLMKLRLSSDVKLTVLIEGKNSNDRVASLLFITLIENAFKHGINNGSESFIDISIFVDSGKGVLCTVENSLVEKESQIEDKNSGIGLANLSKRLELLYPDRHEFIATKKINSFFTLLRIDFGKENTVL